MKFMKKMMDRQQIERLLGLLIVSCLVSGLQTVLASTDATGTSEAVGLQDTTEAAMDAVTGTQPNPLDNTAGSDDTAAAAAATADALMKMTTATSVRPNSISSAGPTMTKQQLQTATMTSAAAGARNATDGWSNGNSTVAGGGGGGGGSGGGGGANATSTASMNMTGNQSANATTSPTVSSILCYNCSGGNCKNLSSDNSSTCTSNTGICYIQYDTVAMVMTLSCKPLYATSGTCNFASQAAKANCEFCCKTNRCNWKTSTEIGQTCLQLLQSSALRHFGFSAAILVLITASHWSFFSLDNINQ